MDTEVNGNRRGSSESIENVVGWKQTFYQTKIVMMMDMEMDIEGEKVSSIQNMDSTLSNFDEVGDIKVPQEVLDTAEEISLEDMQQMENTGQDGGV